MGSLPETLELCTPCNTQSHVTYNTVITRTVSSSTWETTSTIMDTWILLLLSLATLVNISSAFCPHQCVCDDHSLEASCIKSSLEVMPMTLNPGLLKLILKYNHFHSVDASFNFYPELELVDLSSNQLVSIPDRSFSSQRRLKELRMQLNKISELTEKTWSGLSRLEVLDLGHNLIDKLSSKVFKPLKHLKTLNLNQNRISEIDSEAFAGLSELIVLDLSDNSLEIVPTQALDNLVNLAELNLGQNNIKIVPDSSFSPLIKLSSLQLSGNKIERVHEKAFSGLQDLTSLNIRDNQLFRIPSHAFSQFTKLQSLDIGQNKFSNIEEESFISLTKLKSLTVSGSSQLVEISALAFSGLSDLEQLTISNNKKLRIIDQEAFGSDAGVNLKLLDLSNNKLSSLSSSMLSWSSLSSLDLSGNVWECNCNLAFLNNVIINAVNVSDSVSSVRVVRCFSPSSVRNQDIPSLSLQCDVVHSPKTDKSTVTTGVMNNTEIIAIVSASAVVISVILIVIIIKSRKRLMSCISSKSSVGKTPVAQGRILQYSPYQQEPRYVSYQVVQTLHRHPPGPTSVIVNPHSEPPQVDNLLRQENYFLTLRDHEKLHYLSDLESNNYAQAQHLTLLPAHHHVPSRVPHLYATSTRVGAPRQYPDESIYQRVDTDDPVSDI